MEISVLLLVYRRLEKAQKLYAVLQKIKPKKLYISCNAPANPTEVYFCEEIRKLFLHPDWDCEVYTLFQEQHISDCSTSITTGINWFFSQEKKGIILEDDCIPETSFFQFCKLMLDKYEDHESVMHISGTNLLQQTNPNYDYFYSKMILPCWGWASWSRAWKKYTPLMNNWQQHQELILKDVKHKAFWEEILKKNENELIGWDLQWMIDVWVNNSVGIIPSQNMVSNIGYDKYATLTTKEDSKFSQLPVKNVTSFNKTDLSNYDQLLEDLIIDFIKEL
ncbi:MAG: hypothetical protein HY062_06660 [Bacteroidetes bacterium]|nr:hypothetical protein [Bacteroidota bacterium]